MYQAGIWIRMHFSCLILMGMHLQQQVHIKVQNLVRFLFKKCHATVLNYICLHNTQRGWNSVKEKMLSSDNGKNCEKYLDTWCAVLVKEM